MAKHEQGNVEMAEMTAEQANETAKQQQELAKDARAKEQREHAERIKLAALPLSNGCGSKKENPDDVLYRDIVGLIYGRKLGEVYDARKAAKTQAESIDGVMKETLRLVKAELEETLKRINKGVETAVDAAIECSNNPGVSLGGSGVTASGLTAIYLRGTGLTKRDQDTVGYGCLAAKRAELRQAEADKQQQQQQQAAK